MSLGSHTIEVYGIRMSLGSRTIELYGIRMSLGSYAIGIRMALGTLYTCMANQWDIRAQMANSKDHTKQPVNRRCL